MGTAKHPKAFTPEWWEARKRLTEKLVARHRRAGFHPSLHERVQSRRNEQVALYGREVEEQIENPAHWSET